MTILYFDCYSGVAGDMLLASLFDLGVDQAKWRQVLEGLSVQGYKVAVDRVMRHGISALQVDVTTAEKQPHRHLKHIETIIEDSELPDTVKSNALEVFRTLAAAEAKVHNTTPEKIHFHEVGAIDAIVDIVGFCLAVDMLGIDALYAGPVGVGRGVSSCDHGPMPLPPPATLEILRDCPVKLHEIDTELATPTGAAILKTQARFSPPPAQCNLLKVGYGAGSKQLDTLPNIVRAIRLETREVYEYDQALLIETNIDDMNPEIYPFLISRLLTIGAMDVFIQPVVMKKGRPGNVLSALCTPELKSALVDEIYRQTTTLGLRISAVERLKLPREDVQIDTALGRIKGKKSFLGDDMRIAPEYEDCRRIAEERGLPLQEVYQAFNAALGKQDTNA